MEGESFKEKMKFTKSMQKSLESIENDAIKFFPSIKPGLSILTKKKPTKKRVFTGKITNIGKPFFQLFIDGKLFGSYLYDKEEWKENLEE